MPLPRADLESILRARHLDRTLTTVLGGEGAPSAAVAPANLGVLDARLGGGFPRGQLSEIVGPRSSGRTSLVLKLAAAANERGELVALVDALDMLDVESAAAAGVDLTRLLWIRGHVVASPGACRDMNQRAVEQIIRALALVLQSGSFGLVVLDLGEAPRDALRRLPFTTWLRLQRMVEGAETVCVLVGSEPMARSSAGLTLRLDRRAGISDSRLGISGVEMSDTGISGSKEGVRNSECGITGSNAVRRPLGVRFSRLFEGLDIGARVVRARARAQEEDAVALSTVVSNHA